MIKRSLNKALCWGSGVLGILLLFSGWVEAQENEISAMSLMVDEQVVHELMELETARILQQKQQELSVSLPVDFSSDVSTSLNLTDVTALKALYGIGTHVTVEIQHRGRHYFFPAGEKVPLGTKADESELRLSKVLAPSCVELLIQQQPLVRCVVPKLP